MKQTPNFSSFKLQYFSFFLLLLVLLACQQSKQNSSAKNMHSGHETMEDLSCHIPTDSLLGKAALDEKFLKNIETVQTNMDSAKSKKGMVYIKGGKFDMGADNPPGFENMPKTALAQADEYPKHEVEVSSFYMDEHEVTVREFMAFVKATGYKTVAEFDVDWEELKKQVPPGTPKPADELLKAGAMVFHYVPKGTSKDDLGNWWSFVAGVNWKNPDGKNVDIEKILDMPVTQVSWYDAMAYAKWLGKRLPTEAEFEYAMRAGMNNTMYPWGNAKLEPGKYVGNFLQGEFPYENTGADGFEGTSPVKSFPPNAYNLYDISGNVWEWTMDWYGADYYNSLKNKPGPAVNPKGPENTNEVFAAEATNKVVKGGSFFCSDDWCSGYRNSRRMRLSPDSGMQHVGFRCVRDAK